MRIVGSSNRFKVSIVLQAPTYLVILTVATTNLASSIRSSTEPARARPAHQTARSRKTKAACEPIPPSGARSLLDQAFCDLMDDARQ